jgi:hypothetical protein
VVPSACLGILWQLGQRRKEDFSALRPYSFEAVHRPAFYYLRPSSTLIPSRPLIVLRGSYPVVSALNRDNRGPAAYLRRSFLYLTAVQARIASPTAKNWHRQPESNQNGPSPAESLLRDKQSTDNTARLLSSSPRQRPDCSGLRICVSNHDCQIEFRPPLHQRPDGVPNKYTTHERTNKITKSLKFDPFRSFDLLLADTSVTSISGHTGERLRSETAKRSWPFLEESL